MQPNEEQQQPPAPPPYPEAAAQAAAPGWQHQEAGGVPQQGYPGVSQPMQEGWHGAPSWEQAQAWGYGVAPGVWGHHQQPNPMAAGYAMQQQMQFGAAHYMAAQQSSPPGSAPVPPLPMQQQCHGGVIFLCDQRTEEECLQRGLFGLPATQMQIVRAIVPEATLLFLFNVRARQMLGVFRAASWPQQNLEPHAWAEEGSQGSRFPLQVRVRLDSPAVLMLSEERVRSALEYRGTLHRFDLQMSKESAAALAQLFHTVGEPRPPPQLIPMGLGPPGGGGRGGGGGMSDAGSSSGGSGGRGGMSRDRGRRNGLVFICDPSTEAECLQRRLLGLPKSQSSLLSKLTETSLLFLFNVRTRLMLGVFAPDGPAGMELEPDAFGGGSRFPVQVRFTSVNEGGHVLQVPEASLGDVLRYRNASARFDLLLRGRAVDKIVGVFATLGQPVSSSPADALAGEPVMPPLPPQPAPPGGKGACESATASAYTTPDPSCPSTPGPGSLDPAPAAEEVAAGRGAVEIGGGAAVEVTLGSLSQDVSD